MITGVRWFTSRSCVGIAQVVQDHETERYQRTGQADFKYYITAVPGEDEETDKLFVAAFGSPFPTDAGDTLFGVRR
jgi:hypothetical protein